MTSLDQELSTSALIEILVRVPFDAPVPAVSRAFRTIWTSEAFLEARRAFGIQLQLSRPRNSKDLLLTARRVVQRFRCRNWPGSVRVEFRQLEEGEKPSMSFKDPYFKFLQLRDGGVQIPAEPMEEDLYLNGLDPVGGGPVRTAWWAAVRSVLDGTVIPSDARILLLGDRRMGGRSAYSFVLALVWTGKDYGVVKCHLDPTYLSCSMVACGGIQAGRVGSLGKAGEVQWHEIFQRLCRKIRGCHQHHDQRGNLDRSMELPNLGRWRWRVWWPEVGGYFSSPWGTRLPGTLEDWCGSEPWVANLFEDVADSS